MKDRKIFKNVALSVKCSFFFLSGMQFKWQLTFNIVNSFMNFLGFLGHTFIRMLVLALMDLPVSG